MVYGNAFPSPHGDCISQIRAMKYSSNPTERLVSVPLRGLHFSNKKKSCLSTERKYVSVPLRGLHFSNRKKVYIMKNENVTFPSPCGDCISQIFLWTLYMVWQIMCFRPLAGTAFLKSADINHAKNFEKMVSVPLRGLHFSNWDLNHPKEFPNLGFRPLAGTAFLKCPT